MLARLLAGSVLSSLVAVASTGTVARATAAATGSVTATGLQFTLQLNCAGCGLLGGFSATSSGSISGVNGTSPYVAEWTNLAMTGTMGYTSSCLQSAWDGATLTTASATIQGVSLTYGTPPSTSTATVTLNFNGYIEPGAFVPLTNEISITGGPSAITVGNVEGIPGFMTLVPPAPLGSCPGNTQTFTADGTFLTLGAG